MACGDQLENVPKRHLRKVTMYVERFQKEYWKERPTLIWDVDHFMTLKNTVRYTQKVQEINWDLKLKKEGSSATVTINVIPFGYPWNISCYVRYDESFLSANTSARFDAREVSANRYEVTFPRSAIDSQQNYRLINDGTLTLQFEPGEEKRECFYSNRYERDYSRPVNYDVGSILMNRIMPDFAIKPAGGPRIECHKALLAARSIFLRKYFNEFCNNGNEMPVTASFDILRTVVRYVYGFQLEDDLEELRGIMKLTWELDIPSLKTVCIRCVSRITNESFEDLLKDEGINLRLPFLMEKVDTFFANLHRIEQNKRLTIGVVNYVRRILNAAGIARN